MALRSRRLLSEFKKDWFEGINISNNAIIENYNDILNNLEQNINIETIKIVLLNQTYNKIIPIN